MHNSKQFVQSARYTRIVLIGCEFHSNYATKKRVQLSLFRAVEILTLCHGRHAGQ
jgi:hypothetical protein